MGLTLRLRRLVFTLLAVACCDVGLAERIMLQVEDFDGPWRRQTNIGGFRGAGFCTSNANPKIADSVMRKAVVVARPGEYAVWVRAYTSPNSARAVQVEVGGKKLAVTHRDEKTGWSWQRAGAAPLGAGEVKIVIHDADVGFESVDAVLLTDQPGDDPAEEDRRWWIYPEGLPQEADALRFNIDACVALAEKRTDPASKAEWQARRGTIDTELRKAMALEPSPEKTPLEAQITGRADREEYTIENLVFQSRPGFYVTANVYKPKDAAEPLPAVVVTAGHAIEQGKNYDLYRTAQLGLVRQGFLVLAYDPIGQGERRVGGNAHTVGYAAGLVGQCNLTYMIWDTVRALDYLETRKDVDAKRIGVTGNSGGGLNTMYAMPFEPRFAAGASFCCLCSYEAWLKDGGNHCICNHLPGICRHMEEFEFVGLCSPRPLMAGNGEKDPIFPIAGVRDTIRRSKRIYEFDGAGDHIGLSVAPLPHGWSQPLREAAYGWFARWLQNRGDGSPIAEPEIKLDDGKSKDLQCFKDGKFPADAKTYVDLVREEAARRIAAYGPVPPVADRAPWTADMRKRLWEVLGGEPAVSEPAARSLGSFAWRGHTVERLAIQTEPGIEVPALLFRSATALDRAPTVVVLDDDGKSEVPQRPELMFALESGVHVLAMDPRAIGEGAVMMNHCASDAIVLGRPLLGQQAWDVIAAVRYLAIRPDVDPDAIVVCARGKVGLIATLAGALSDNIRATVALGSLASFTDAIADPLPQPLWAYATSILDVADVPQLEAMHGPRPLLRLDGSDGESIQRAVEFLEKALSP